MRVGRCRGLSGVTARGRGNEINGVRLRRGVYVLHSDGGVGNDLRVRMSLLRGVPSDVDLLHHHSTEEGGTRRDQR